MATLFIRTISSTKDENAPSITLPVKNIKDFVNSEMSVWFADVEKFKEGIKKYGYDIDINVGDQLKLVTESGKLFLSIEIDFIIPLSHMKAYLLHYFDLLEKKLQKDKAEINSNSEKLSKKSLGFGMGMEKSILEKNGIPLTMLGRYTFKIQQYITELESVFLKFNTEKEDETIFEKYNLILQDIEGLYHFDTLLGSFDRIPTAICTILSKESKDWILKQIY